MAKDDVKPCFISGARVCRYNAPLMPLRPRQPSGGGRPTTLALLATLILTGASIAPTTDASPGPPTAASGTGPKSKSAPRSTGPGLRWPLEIPGTLLSTFGEYRYDHL